MPHDAKTVGLTLVEKTGFGQHDLAMHSKYEAPANGAGGIDTDTFKLKDFEAAGMMAAWLQREYPGHFWATKCDMRQGVAMFNIPALMGMDWWYVINLHTHDIVDTLKKGGGELLERYHLKRGRFVLDEFLDARQNLGRMVLPFRKVPT